VHYSGKNQRIFRQLSRSDPKPSHLDWQSRQAERKGKATAAEMAEIRAKIKALLKLA
jgi:hypothetical protein